MEAKANQSLSLNDIVYRLKQSQFVLSVENVSQLHLSDPLKVFLKEMIELSKNEDLPLPQAKLSQQLLDLGVKEIQEISSAVELVIASQPHNIAHQSVGVQNNFHFYSKAHDEPSLSTSPLIATENSTPLLIERVRKYYTTGDRVRLRTVFGSEKDAINIQQAFINLAIVKKERSLNPQVNEEHNNQNESPDLSKGRMLNSHEQIYGKKESTEIFQLFSPLYSEDKDVPPTIPSKILIEGWAGIGKSVLCQYLANDWASHSENIKQQWWPLNTELVLWIPLRNLTHYDSENCRLGEVVRREFFGIEDSENLNYLSAAQIEADLAALKEKVVLLLDGFDEVADWYNEVKEGKKQELTERSHLLSNVLLANRNNHRIVVTSRPNRVTSIKQPFDRRLETIGFTDANIDKYIKRYFEKNLERGNALLSAMKSNMNLWGIAHIPVNLALICLVWKDTPFSAKVPHYLTMTHLYTSVVEWLLRRDWAKHPCESKDDVTHFLHLNEDQIRLDAQSIPLKEFEEKLASYPEKLSVLKEIAWLAQTTNYQSILIGGTEVSKTIEKYNPWAKRPSQQQEAVNHLRTLGLLESQDNSNKIPVEKNQYYFPHLTFQEFFAAKYWVGMFIHPETKETAKEYLRTHKYNPKDEVMWWFVGVLLKNQPKALSEFFNTLEEEPRDTIGLYHEMLLIRCHDESALQAPSHKDFMKRLGEKMRSFLISDNLEHPHGNKIFFHYLSQSPRIFQHEDCSGVVLSLLQIKNHTKRANVFYNLGPGPLPLVILNRLVTYCQDDDYNLREEAIKVLGEQSSLPESILEELVGHFSQENPRVRQDIAHIIGHQSLLPTPLLEKLAGYLWDENSTFRRSAIEALSRQSLPVPILERILDLWWDERMNVRLAAAKALGRQSSLPESILNTLIDLLEHDEKSGRAFGRHSSRPPQRTLGGTVGVNKEDLDVRNAAKRILSRQSSLPDSIIKRLRSFSDGKEAADRALSGLNFSGFYEGILEPTFGARKRNENFQNIAPILRHQFPLFDFIPTSLEKLSFEKAHNRWGGKDYKSLESLSFHSLIMTMKSHFDHPVIIPVCIQIILERCFDVKIPVYCDLKNENCVFIGQESFCFDGKEEKNIFLTSLIKANEMLMDESFHSGDEKVSLSPSLETTKSGRFFCHL